MDENKDKGKTMTRIFIKVWEHGGTTFGYEFNSATYLLALTDTRLRDKVKRRSRIG